MALKTTLLLILFLAAGGCRAPEPYRDQNPDAPDTGVVIIGEEPVAVDDDEFFRTDHQILLDVRKALDAAGLRHVTVDVVNSDVYLRGWTDSATSRSEAAELAADVDGVDSVFAGEILTR